MVWIFECCPLSFPPRPTANVPSPVELLCEKFTKAKYIVIRWARRRGVVCSLLREIKVEGDEKICRKDPKSFHCFKL